MPVNKRLNGILTLISALNTYYLVSYGQNATEYNLAEYKKNEVSKIDTIITNYETSKKKDWLNILPNINYNLSNRTFNMGVSLNSFATYYQQKKRNKIELERLKQELLKKLDDKILSLENRQEILTNEIEYLKASLSNAIIKNKLFLIRKKQYDNNKITLEKWLEIQSNYIAFYNAKVSSYNALKQKQIKLNRDKKNPMDVGFNVLNEINIKLNSISYGQR